MKKHLSTLILILLTLNTFGQDNKLGISSGYIADVLQFIEPGFGDKPQYIKDNPSVYGKLYHGYTFKGWYQRKLNTDYWISLETQMAQITYNFNDPCQIYWEEKKSDNYLIICLSLSKDILENSAFDISPKIGLLYRHLNLSNVDYDIIEDDDKIYINSLPRIYSQVFKDLGVGFGTDFSYSFKNNFFIGISFQGNYIFDIGIETFEINPILGICF